MKESAKGFIATGFSEKATQTDGIPWRGTLGRTSAQSVTYLH